MDPQWFSSTPGECTMDPMKDPSGLLAFAISGWINPRLLDILTLEEFSDQSILVLSVGIHGLVVDHAFFAHAPHHTATQTLHSNQSTVFVKTFILCKVQENYDSVTKWTAVKKQSSRSFVAAMLEGPMCTFYLFKFFTINIIFLIK